MLTSFSLLAVLGGAAAMRAPTVQVGRSAVTMRASGIKESYTWATVLDTSDLRPGSVASGVAFNQEIAVVATPDGSLYACTNKAPPTGQPLTFSRPGADKTIQDPVCGTKWDLETGEVKPGTWMSSLLPGAILKLFLKEPERLSVFPIRTQGSKVQVYLNKNAFAQYDGQYWKGILDAQGKADGGYY
mmetsp:Transcript_11486/g.29890  ORF Transcript_11486/g.29890 Transcript_11486/m.29890 type:complete len:187 (+) Transcript_11486:72-632(+)